MLKRIVLLGLVGAFLAAPPAIAKSSSTVKSPAPENTAPENTAPDNTAPDNTAPHDGPCPFGDASFEF